MPPQPTQDYDAKSNFIKLGLRIIEEGVSSYRVEQQKSLEHTILGFKYNIGTQWLKIKSGISWDEALQVVNGLKPKEVFQERIVWQE